MTREDKELLLTDLSARLPYNVKVNEDIQGDVTLMGLTKERALTTCEVEGYFNDFPIELVKPYLFPLSSIDDVIRGELVGIKVSVYESGIVESSPRLIDFYNKHHIDYRGLIPMGLALDATGLNIY